MSDELDVRVRSQVYRVTMQCGYPPSIEEISSALNLTSANVRSALGRLGVGRALVLQPDSDEILMANPFSAVPTLFVVETQRYSCYGNCIWDAMGIAAVLRQDVRIKTSCADCGLAYN